MGCSGLSSMVFLEVMYEDMEASLKAYAFMILSMLADHPCSPVTRTQGASTILLEIITFSILSPRTSLISLQRDSYYAFYSSNFFFSSSVSSSSNPSLVQFLSFFPSYSFNYWITYSSMGSTIYKTSYPLFLSDSMNGELATAALDSPVMK